MPKLLFARQPWMTARSAKSASWRGAATLPATGFCERARAHDRAQLGWAAHHCHHP